MKAFAGNKLNVAEMMISPVNRVENTVGNGGNAGTSISFFPTVFSKAFFLKVVKSRDYVETNQQLSFQSNH